MTEPKNESKSKNTNTNIADEKLFSLNDLIDMGLITRKDIEDSLRYLEAKKTVDDLFKGMF